MIKKDEMSKFLNNGAESCMLAALFCLPFSKSAVEVFVVLSIALFLARKIALDRDFELKINRATLSFLILFVTFNVLSLANSQYPEKSVPALFSKVIKWALFFISVAGTIRTEKQAKKVFVIMLCSCGLILADAVYQQYITGKDFLHYPSGYPVFKFHGRVVGSTTFPTASFPYPNDFATWINVYLFAFLAMFISGLKNKKILKIITVLFCAALGFFLFLTTTGGAIAGAISAVAILTLINIRRFLLPIVVVLVLAILAVSLVPYLRVYLNDGILNKALSINDRQAMWTAGWKIFKQHPVIGNGVNTFFEHFKYFREDEDKYAHGSYAHNCILQMAADTGILGALSFLLFSFFIIINGITRAIRSAGGFKESLALGLSLGLVAFLVHSVFDTNLYSLNLAALFWTSAGIIEGIGGHK